MKLIKKNLNKDKSGIVVLMPQEPEDMWHLYNLILAGDKLKAFTVRKIQNVSNTGSTDSQRIPCTLNITVETVDFDVQASAIRINGKVCEENEFVKMGAYHTIDLALNKNLTLYKDEWDRIALDRIKTACDVTQSAEIVAVMMQEGLANICLLTEHRTVVYQKIEMNVPKKRRGSSTLYEKGLEKFFEQILLTLIKCVKFDIVKAIILASPGFLKEQLFNYIMDQSIKRDMKVMVENKSKFLQIHSSSGHKSALMEILQDPIIKNQLNETKYAQEVKALDDFFEMLSHNPDKAFYGYDHVKKAADIGAISTLLLTDTLFRSNDIATRKKYLALADKVKETSGKVYIFSGLHISGEQLDQITGVAAILLYPAPHIEEEVELELEQLKLKEKNETK